MTNQTATKSFILHLDSLEILEKLSDEQAGKIFKSIYKYQKNGKVQDELDFALDLVITPFLNQFKRDKERWEIECEKSSNKGKIGNLKRWHKEIYKRFKKGELTLSEALLIATRSLTIPNDPTQSTPIPKSLDSKNKNKNKNDSKNDNKNNLPIFINENLFDDFAEMRKKLKKPLTEKAKELLIKKLSEFEDKQSGFANKALENSIENSWQGIFEPKQNQGTSTTVDPIISKLNTLAGKTLFSKIVISYDDVVLKCHSVASSNEAKTLPQTIRDKIKQEVLTIYSDKNLKVSY